MVLVPTRPPPGPSFPSPNRRQGWLCLRSCLGDSEVEELLLSEAGEFGVEESGVDWAAAAGLQCAQTKILKPRPLQLLQIDPLQRVC